MSHPGQAFIRGYPIHPIWTMRSWPRWVSVSRQWIRRL